MTDQLTLDYEDGRSLRSGFLRQTVARPGSTALRIGQRAWTYADLEHQARAWAGGLIAACEDRPRRVGVLGYRSETSYVGVLAALLAGATFVSLNPSFPPARTAAMIELAQLDAIVLDERHADYLGETLSSLAHTPTVIAPGCAETPRTLDTVFGQQDLERCSPLSDLPPVFRADIAYLIFTSGSTGVPKGVPVMHSNVLHFIDAMQDRYRLGPEDRLSQTFDQSFDGSIFDVFMALEVGASLHVPSAIELVAPTPFINREELTVWFSVPSIASLMRRKRLLQPDTLPTLRWSLFGGEPLPRETAELWQAAAPGSVLENLYGPTEVTIGCFAHRWDPQRSPPQCVNDTVPIGRPSPGLGILVLDEQGNSVEDGSAGELLVCGPQTVPGYWRSPEKTAERFLRLPVQLRTSEHHATFYTTGDRVIRNDHGTYAYLGRTDDQVKVSGHRIELGEIEAVLRGVAGVVDAVAAPWPVRNGAAEGIVAFLTGTEPSIAGVLDHARALLPKYMIPAKVIVVDDMPLNASGKIDRKALLAQLGSAA